MKDFLFWIWSEATERVGYLIQKFFNLLSKAVIAIAEAIPKIVGYLQKD